MEAGIEGVVNGVASAKSRAREERRGRNGEEHDLRETGEEGSDFFSFSFSV